MMMNNSSWAAKEFSCVDLGDKRLNERLIKLCDSLSESPESPINQACQDWSETKAAYRFFQNEKVDCRAILSSHRAKTIERVEKHSTILALQDTSYIMYTHHPKTTGLGRLTMVKGKSVAEVQSKGLLMHTCLAVSTDGLPLGLLDQEIFSRCDSEKKKGGSDGSQPIEEKESYRWLKSLKESVEPISGTQVVTVCDREADIYEFFEQSVKSGSRVLVRAKANRVVNRGSKYATRHIEKVWSFMAAQQVAGELEVDVVEREASKHSRRREARVAQVEIRFGRFQMSPPKRLRSNSADIDMSAIYVTEKGTPEGAEPLEWMLLTDLEIKNFEDACEKVRWYKLRWRIEMFFKVLKSGFRVEHCRLGEAERLRRYLTVMSIIAWRLFAITLIARSKPELGCEQFLSETEWKVLALKANKNKKTPTQPPTMEHVVIWIAKLGGFLARKNDGEPGTLVLWRGWKKLQDIADGYNLAVKNKTCG
jgi:hypothetical protein